MTADPGPSASAGLDRGDLLRIVGLIAALLAVVGVVLLASGGDGGGKRSTGQMHGVLTEVGETRLVLQPSTGGDAEEFTVRPQDRRNLDLFHLEQHAADALPSIVHYEQEGDERFAVRVDDA